MHRIASALALLVVGLAAAGCGDESKNAATTPAATTSAGTTPATTTPADTTPAQGSSDDASAVRQVLAELGRADTPETACALLSARIRRGLLRRDADACRDKKKFEAALGVELKPTDLKTTKVRVTGDKAEADTEAAAVGGGPPQKQKWRLVKEDGSWKVDSLDQPSLQAPPSSSEPAV